MDGENFSRESPGKSSSRETFPTVAAAYQAAREAASNRDMIYIGGSTFVVAEVI